jgi:CelD/BcsL family acetyltransferase involved in cellulose biosynthesis
MPAIDTFDYATMRQRRIQERSAERGWETAAPQSPLTLEIISDVDGLLMLQDEWESLILNSSASIFQSYDWISLWWSYFGRGERRDLYIMVLRSQGKLVGIAPFYVQLDSWRNTVLSRTLKTMGGAIPTGEPGYAHYSYYSPSDFMDIIAARSYETSVGLAVAHHINGTHELFDDVHFANVPDDGVLFKYVLPFIHEDRFQILVGYTDQCPRLSVPPTIEGYFSTLKSQVRRKLHQSWSFFTSDSIARIDAIDTQEELARAFAGLISMHQERWNALGYPGMFADTRFNAFQQELTSRFFEKGWLRCLKAGYAGNVVGCRMAYAFNGRIYDYLSGFSPSLPGANRRPGFALLTAMIDNAIDEGMESVEFLRGNEQYKLDIAPDARHIWNITLTSRTSEKSVCMMLAHGIKSGKYLLHRLRMEAFLVGVQFREHGTIMFLPSYLAFVTLRLRTRKAPFFLRLAKLLRKSRSATTGSGSGRS